MKAKTGDGVESTINKRTALRSYRYETVDFSLCNTMVATAPTGTPLEALFRPTTRFRDRLGWIREGFTELELLPGLTIENVLATGVTWGDFLSFVRGKLVWMTPDVYVCSRHFYGGGDPWVLTLAADGGTGPVGVGLFVRVTPDTDAAEATTTCDFMVRLLATCERREAHIDGYLNDSPLPISGAALSLFFQESRDDLRKVVLYNLALSADLCQALATMSRLDVELDLLWCTLADDAAGAFVECLQSEKGPVKLDNCKVDSRIIADALTGNSRVTTLTPLYGRTNDAETAISFRALANNRGLVDLDWEGRSISNDNWTILCESLQAHRTLTKLDLDYTSPRSPDGSKIVLTDDQKAQRTRVLANMVQRNTVLHTITLCKRERDEQIYTEEILPHLETNLYRPRVLAVKKTKERPFRKKVLGRALDSVKSNPNLVWMFLSENVDAFARTEEDEDEESHIIEVPGPVTAVVVAVAAVAIVAVVAGAGAGIGSKRKR
jgi:hypothetical protein